MTAPQSQVPVMQSSDRLCKPATHYAAKRPVLRICDPLCSLVTGYVNLRLTMQPSDPFCESATRYAAKQPAMRICNPLCSQVPHYQTVFPPSIIPPHRGGVNRFNIINSDHVSHKALFHIIIIIFLTKNIVFLVIFIKLRKKSELLIRLN